MKTILQTLCAVLVAAGICVEFYCRANIGFTLITSGSLAFAISTKINERVKKLSCKGVRNDAVKKNGAN